MRHPPQGDRTPLQFAIEADHLELAELLVEKHGASAEVLKNGKLLHAAKKGDLDGVKAAIEAGANLEAKISVRGMNQQCTRLSPPPPSHSVLPTRLLPHAPPH